MVGYNRRANNLIYKAPREGRIIGGVVASIFAVGLLFFTTLVALESFSDNPFVVTLFFLLGLLLFCGGLYFALCAAVIEINSNEQIVKVMTSCLLFRRTRTVPFSSMDEAGIIERYYAGDRTGESGTFYFVELRGTQTIEVPGTKSNNLNETASIAREIADGMAVSFNPKIRKVFTGSYKIK